MAESLKELRSLSNDELIKNHDELAKQTVVGTRHYLNELYRRDTDRATRTIVRLTWSIAGMTVIVTLATIAMLLSVFYR